MIEQMAVMMLGRFARFAPSPRWRNISVFGMLDEIRHAQLDLLFSHDLLKHEARFDWCQKAFHTNEWGIIAIRSFCDDWLLSANCVDSAIAVHLTFEHGFTNMQFIALAAFADIRRRRHAARQCLRQANQHVIQRVGAGRDAEAAIDE